MSKSADVRIYDSDGGEAERALKQASLNLKILDYINKNISDKPLSGEVLNQSVIFIEIAMGHRNKFTDEDYKLVVQKVKNRNIINREMFENILDILEIEKSKRVKMSSFWD